MNIGDEVLIRARVVDIDPGPYGESVTIEVAGYTGKPENIGHLSKRTRILINRPDWPMVLAPSAIFSLHLSFILLKLSYDPD